MSSLVGFRIFNLTIIFLVILFLVTSANIFAERLTLEECIAIAKENNPDIRAAYNNYRISNESVWQAYGGLLPRLDSWIGGSRTITGPTDILRWDQNTNQIVNASTGVSVSKNYSAGFQLSQVLFNGGTNVFNVFDARAAAKARRYSYIGTRKDIIYQVKEKYFSLLRAKMLVDVRSEAVKRGEEQLKIAQSRYDLGSASLSDVLKAKVQYGNDKLDFVDAKNTYLLAKADLNYIMNRDVNLEIEPVEEFTAREVEYDFETALETAMKNHPGLLSAEESLKSSKYQKLSARGNWFPSLSIRASYSWNDQKLNELDKFADENYRWNLSGTLSFNIFNGFQTKATYNTYRIAYRTAQDSYYAAKNGVRLEVKQAYLNLQRARENLQLTKESEEAAQEDFNLAQEKYNLGAATILDLIDAQVSFKQAEANRIQALFDYNLAISQLEKAMGL